MRVSEIFGFGIGNHSDTAWNARKQRYCQFKHGDCTKVSKDDPMGICSFSDGRNAAVVCPTRFLEDNRIFSDAGAIAFGATAQIAIFPEVRLLKIEAEEGGREKKIGKIDFLMGLIVEGRITDFAALEVQAVYISGASMRPNFDEYIANGRGSNSFVPAERRPDFRSSAQKRLVPQLQLKVPVFRRWGKKFFVVVDEQFFSEMPHFPTTSRSNSELTWLSYPVANTGVDYTLGEPNIIYSNWDDVANALREGKPPEPDEIIAELQAKFDSNKPTLIVDT